MIFGDVVFHRSFNIQIHNNTFQFKQFIYTEGGSVCVWERERERERERETEREREREREWQIYSVGHIKHAMQFCTLYFKHTVHVKYTHWKYTQKVHVCSRYKDILSAFKLCTYFCSYSVLSLSYCFMDIYAFINLKHTLHYILESITQL